ncbi:ribonuclease R [candidate division KSB1 bacterium]|nr:ribonuclease R [candidate division KSB1 bacterium]RQW05130.1 MAG: ribonuclease R [candidate division KSB1 bacterium]
MNKLSQRVLDLLRSEPFRTYKAKEIQRLLNLPQNKYQGLRTTLRELVRSGHIVKLKKNHYGCGQKTNEIVGELRVNSQGYGFVSREKGDDVFVSMKNMGQALHKDKVRVRLFATTSGKSVEGQIVEVLERARETIVGTFRWGRKYGYVVPDDLKIQRDIIVAAGDDLGAREGQKVVCKIEEWEHYGLTPSGRVIEILGFPDEAGVDIQSLVHRHEISSTFPDAVLQQAESIAGDLTEELDRRLDLRGDIIYTIDPEDAKDFDDAMSLDKLENGNWRLGVHIADVSFYIPEKSALDREALKRGTSVYLVDRVIPMLPERLSNELCSLAEAKDKLTFSVLMTLSPQGKLLAYDIKESVIRSVKRFNYVQAQRILDGGEKSLYAEKLQDMYELSQVLIKRRRNRGSIDFDTIEVEIPLNDNGEPIAIRRRDRLATHRLVEEFMLLANETVAKHIGIVLKEKTGQELPFIYRIHESPDKQSVLELVQMAHAFGIDVAPPTKITPRFFQTIADDFQQHPASGVLQDQLLRTMMKAQYSPTNVGHFGLAYRYYTHFTSPIRRYPDLMVHRLLKKYAHKEMDSSLLSYQDIEKICIKSTENEIRAQNAERDSIKLKQLQYLEDHVNEWFDGIIVRIVNFGFFVQLPAFQVDGLVHITSLDDDYYIVDEKKYRLYGASSGKEFKLGAQIKVKLIRVDRNENLIDFVISD